MTLHTITMTLYALPILSTYLVCEDFSSIFINAVSEIHHLQLNFRDEINPQVSISDPNSSIEKQNISRFQWIAIFKILVTDF